RARLAADGARPGRPRGGAAGRAEPVGGPDHQRHHLQPELVDGAAGVRHRGQLPHGAGTAARPGAVRLQRERQVGPGGEPRRRAGAGRVPDDHAVGWGPMTRILAGMLLAAFPLAAEEIDYKRLYASSSPAVVLIYGEEGDVGSVGTGSIIERHGLVVTN